MLPGVVSLMVDIVVELTKPESPEELRSTLLRYAEILQCVAAGTPVEKQEMIDLREFLRGVAQHALAKASSTGETVTEL